MESIVAKDVVEQIKNTFGSKEKYWVCRIYLNGETVWGTRTEEELLNFLAYNSKYRFGCALIVEGKCFYRGYYLNESLPKLEERIINEYNKKQ